MPITDASTAVVAVACGALVLVAELPTVTVEVPPQAHSATITAMALPRWNRLPRPRCHIIVCTPLLENADELGTRPAGKTARSNVGRAL
jgi:hypothetical protein